ncbi:MAG: hypothetical protein HS100_04350 [Anaerolineales bacterium]|nr:hypothetical protein [Anaerolineales bacterium]
MVQVNLPPLDLEAEKRKALAKVYSLLIKLAEEKEITSAEIDSVEEVLEPLKTNNPTQGRV